jgi:hypothetical protein
MPKNTLEDIVIRPRNKEEVDRGIERLYTKKKPDLTEETEDDHTSGGKTHYGLWFVAFIAVVFIFFVFSFAFF